ncbi:cytochrome P-450 cyp509A1 [Spinellus fusiger]|nr:cytochrome P-450 cyp509A1 [Spinellus fusiger]
MVSSPQAAKQILLRMDKFPRIKLIMGADGTVLNKYIGGPNIVCLNGHDWKRHRKIANPVFNRSMHVKLFGHLTQTMFNTIGETNGTVDMVDLFERWTLDAIGKAGFGFDFRALVDKNNKWVENYNNIKEGMTRLFFLIFPILDTKLLHLFPKRQALHEKLNEFLGMLDSIIDQKRRTIIKEDTNQEGDNGKDLLTLMIESEMSGEGALSDEELRSNLCIFFLAGHDTTAFSLAFAIYEMAVNQNIQDRAREEAIRILGDKPEDVLPDLEQTKEMEYINMVMKETLRMHNPVFNSTEHYASEDCEIDGVFIPKGTHIALDILSLHRNPTVWNDPHTFNPERFAPGGETDNQTHGNMSWLPFGAGARQCVGMNFSISEQRVALSMMLRKYKWHLPEDSIHKDVLQSRGIGFGLITAKDLNITFEKLY